MWRSIIVYNGEKITIKQDHLSVITENKEKHIPLEDLNCVVVDNLQTSISAYTLVMLAKYNVVLITCNQSHMPTTMTLPTNTNYHLYKVFKMQVELPMTFKKNLWREIIKSKIKNQSFVLSYVGGSEDIVDRLKELSDEVTEGDKGNREGIAAKMFFRNIYGSNFIRYEDDSINAALNYGYAIIRSSVAKTLVAYGFQTFLGIHHISETNAFNLADDFMEPLRPLVDYYVASNIEDIVLSLDKYIRSDLVNLLNVNVETNNHVVKVRYAIDMMIKSFYTAIEREDPSKLAIPIICKIEL